MSEKAFVLIVDDDAPGGQALADRLHRAGHACKLVASAEEALESVRHRPPDVVVTPHRPEGGLDGLQVLRQTKAHSPDTEVVLITDGSADSAPLTAPSPDGAYERLIRPLDLDVVQKTVDGAARQAMTARHHRLLRTQREQALVFEGLLTANETLRKELRRVSKLAPTKSAILIVGESGTGKELIAHAIHAHSPRRNKAFIAINCASISETIAESELFGHVKGSFTGAYADRKGLLEAADGGTLFLDEIGDMPSPLQAKILRTLESGEIMRVGSNELRHVDVRVVAATHRDLWERVEEGTFREDLFYRLHAHGAIRLPPLRERRDDIPLLVQHFIEWADQQNGRAVQGVTPEALRKLTAYGWRGNVRELKHVLERAVVETEKELLDIDDLPPAIRGSSDIVPVGVPGLGGLSMADVERLHILSTLKMAGGNREKAANILKIGTRTLYRKLKDYGVT